MAATSNANHMHLTLTDRIYIEQALERRMKYKDIADVIEKDPSTVSKEVRRHRCEKTQVNGLRSVSTAKPVRIPACAINDPVFN